MATLTKISPSRMGPPRFGNRPHNIDTSVKTYQLTPEQLERLRAGENLDDILKEEKEMEQQKPKVIAYAKYEEVVAERDELKKQLEELQTNMEKEVEHWKEFFETAMADKERLQKENLILENEVQRLKELVSELTERNDRYSDEWFGLHKELRALRLYALEKLQKDVYGVS
jgi:chromosome segregation ATPase